MTDGLRKRVMLFAKAGVLSLLAIVFCVEYCVAVWFVLAVPWVVADASFRHLDMARVLALALPPTLLAGGMILIRLKRATQGQAMLLLSLAILLTANWHLDRAHGDLLARGREAVLLPRDHGGARRRFEQVAGPVLGGISAYGIEIEELYGVADHATEIRFRTDDLERLKEGLKSHGWFWDGLGWQRQKMLNGVGGQCVLWYYRDKSDGSWVVHFSEVR